MDVLHSWRWGLGMFAIMMPVLLIPAILTLYGVQRRADKLGTISFGEAGMARKEGIKVHSGKDYLNLAWRGAIEIDLAGLILLGLGFALVLLSFNLSKAATGGWSNPSMIAMLVIGFVILGFFIAFEVMIAPKPIMTRRIFHNKAFICALIVNVSSQMASSTRATYFSSYMYIIKNWSNYAWNTFLNTTTLVLCIFGALGGIIHRISHRYKTLMVLGAVLRLIGNAILMTTDVRSTQDTATLVVSQLLLGCGAFAVIGARVGSQASVPHEDLSSAIAIIALWSTLASSVGSTIAGSIWQDKMLPYMREEMPNVPEKTLKSVYGSIKKLRTEYSWDDPIREGAVRAYTRVNGILFLVALVVNILPVIFSLCMPGKKSNAVASLQLPFVLIIEQTTISENSKVLLRTRASMGKSCRSNRGFSRRTKPAFGQGSRLSIGKRREDRLIQAAVCRYGSCGGNGKPRAVVRGRVQAVESGSKPLTCFIELHRTLVQHHLHSRLFLGTAICFQIK